MRNAELKILTVREIMEMINEEELRYNHKFVYARSYVKLDSGRKVTKASMVINAILDQKLILSTLTLWKNTDTNQLTIHDGIQTLLSIYYFINPSVEINITTTINGRDYLYDGLPPILKEELLNFEFSVLTIEGNTLEQEKCFEAWNS